ncbi:beta-propeller domain-containing protein [Chryseomicrobium palamuruense]|uniref:Beta-propeller domain-containing protein n=1 Tax=Chryseomicrobium palamuruense TaxID=682973 RepID=A0ABV8URW1_9BACL
MKKWRMPLFATLLVAALVGGFYWVSDWTGATVQANPEMTVVTKEDELRDYFERVKKAQREFNLGFGMVLEEAESEDSSAADSAKSSNSGTGGGESDVSSTNNQVEGVDEADTVKLNEDYLFTVSNQEVVIFDIQNPEAMKETGRITFGGDRYPHQLFLTNEYLIVMNQNYIHTVQPKVSGSAEDAMWMPSDGMAMASIYSLEDPANPTLVREIGSEGYLSHARLTDNTVYFISNLYDRMWAFQENEDIELRPFSYDSEEGEKSSVVDYEDITILPDTLEGSYTMISALSLDDLESAQLTMKGYLGSSEQLYMSTESLYLTTTIYESSETTESDGIMDRIMIWNPGVRDTEVFKFSIDKTSITYVASHRLEGHLLNQFSMDEYNGHFRVVTTEGDAWNEKQLSENHLFILDANMNRVGEIKGLAKDERIYSARFMGDKAYMVTFKETDPLFVFDVADPKNPKVLGELKIPGFSNYLHPVGENHLLGIGYDTEMVTFPGMKEPSVVTGGMKLSLFDVSDFANPKEQDTEIIGGQGTYSPVHYDHKALMIHQEKNYYGFPVTVYTGKAGQELTFEGEGAMIYKVTPEEGITRAASLMNEKVEGQQYEEWEKLVQRLVYVDDTLYTVAMNQIESYDFTTFEKKQTLTY